MSFADIDDKLPSPILASLRHCIAIEHAPESRAGNIAISSVPRFFRLTSTAGKLPSMAKHSRKRQRLEKATESDSLPLGARPSLTDDASKDDEERRLESLLFGTPFVPSGKGKETILVVGNESDGGDEANAGGAAEFEGLLDDDVSDRHANL